MKHQRVARIHFNMEMIKTLYSRVQIGLIHVGLPLFAKVIKATQRVRSLKKCPGDDILYCLSGRGRIETETHSFDLSPGQLAWIAGDKPHGHFADEREPWSLMWFRLDGPDLATLRRRLFGNRWSRMTILQSSELIDWFHNLFLILERQRIDTDLSLNAAVASFI